MYTWAIYTAPPLSTFVSFHAECSLSCSNNCCWGRTPGHSWKTAWRRSQRQSQECSEEHIVVQAIYHAYIMPPHKSLCNFPLQWNINTWSPIISFAARKREQVLMNLEAITITATVLLWEFHLVGYGDRLMTWIENYNVVQHVHKLTKVSMEYITYMFKCMQELSQLWQWQLLLAVHFPPQAGITALSIASWNGHVEVVEILLHQHADVSIYDAVCIPSTIAIVTCCMSAVWTIRYSAFSTWPSL